MLHDVWSGRNVHLIGHCVIRISRYYTNEVIKAVIASKSKLVQSDCPSAEAKTGALTAMNRPSATKKQLSDIYVE